ncbi:MAG: hypothetical protein MUF84_10715 [Anaerolineae bacterium]|nr:hypothetical protein [Anaerolineae bacterium]
MPKSSPAYGAWSDLASAPRSPYFGGDQTDVAFDRSRYGRNLDNTFAPNDEALFIQSNARVLLGHAANGGLRFVALPTSLYPAPTGSAEYGLGPGMYHHFDAVMLAPDMVYRLEFDDDKDPLIVSSFDAPLSGLSMETAYIDDFLPVSTGEAQGLKFTLVSVAPVAADARTAPLAPAPLPGPAGMIYALHIRNEQDQTLEARLVLQVRDALIDGYEGARIDRQALDGAQVHLRQQTLLLTQPYGAAGIHLYGGHWRRLESPFQAEVAFTLAPGEERVFETHVALGAGYADVFPALFALHMRSVLEWLEATRAFWRDRLGVLEVDADGAREEARVTRDVYVRSLLDNFNCLQTDADGALLAHWQGAPSHGYGTVWGIDVEPTAVSVVHICPELTWAVLRFFLERSRVPRGTPDHSVPILVAPIIIARQWLQITGDSERLVREPAIMGALRGIIADLMALKSAQEMLFPTRYSSDGAVGRRYDYGTNVKVWYAFDSMAYLSEQLGDSPSATAYRNTAGAIRDAIARRMTGNGPFGPQLLGGTNLGEPAGDFYLQEGASGKGAPYYDGEDTSSMLSPTYGMIDTNDQAWINYHAFARSPWCPNFDPEFGALRWSPRGFYSGALDGTAYFSRLAGSVTRQEMLEAVRALWTTAADEVTGSVFWWPYGLEYRRALTRCSQGQGAFAWQYLKQWLGLEVDANAHVLTVAPLGMLTSVSWRGFRAGAASFDIAWQEQPSPQAPADARAPLVDAGGRAMWQPVDFGERCTVVQITNLNREPWFVRLGFRAAEAGATGPLAWRTAQVAPGGTLSLIHPAIEVAQPPGLPESTILARSVAAMGSEGILFRRFGPEQLWGHWELDARWDPLAMPLTVRFHIANATGVDWHDVRVSLVCPDGWLAQGRPPRLWPRPTALESTASVDLGALPNAKQDVTPFWVMWPPDIELVPTWDRNGVPFHANTQPGQGLTLVASNVDRPVHASFEAVLAATTDSGKTIERALTVPILIVPAGAP